MGYEAKTTEHCGPKHGSGVYWGCRWDAKKESNRIRRENAKRELRDAVRDSGKDAGAESTSGSLYGQRKAPNSINRPVPRLANFRFRSGYGYVEGKMRPNQVRVNPEKSLCVQELPSADALR